jgi:hypothetical protein
MTGLELVARQGMAAISEAIGGIWGAALEDLGSRILGGDFAGAWDTAVKGMGAIWDVFTVGVVSGFASAIREMQKMWKPFAEDISNWLIKQGARKDWFKGTADEGRYGIRVQDPIGWAARALLGVDEVAEQSVAPAQELARQQLDSTEERINEYFENLKSVAEDAAMAAGESLSDHVASGAEEAAERIRALSEELAALRAEAATRAAAAKKAREEAAAAGPEGIAGAKAGGPIGSFSDVALQRLGGGGPQDKTVMELRASRRVAEEQRREAIKQRVLLDSLLEAVRLGPGISFT